MWTSGGCLAMIFLGLVGLVTTLALRSAWRHRFEPPLTTLRLLVLVLFTIGATVAAVVTRTDWVLVPMIGGVFVVSVGWLVAKGS